MADRHVGFKDVTAGFREKRPLYEMERMLSRPGLLRVCLDLVCRNEPHELVSELLAVQLVRLTNG